MNGPSLIADIYADDEIDGYTYTYNLANEETPCAGSSDYDLVGNMCTLQSGKTARYDAWRRLVAAPHSATGKPPAADVFLR
jgi:hypothetical protein